MIHTVRQFDEYPLFLKFYLLQSIKSYCILTNSDRLWMNLITSLPPQLHHTTTTTASHNYYHHNHNYGTALLQPQQPLLRLYWLCWLTVLIDYCNRYHYGTTATTATASHHHHHYHHIVHRKLTLSYFNIPFTVQLIIIVLLIVCLFVCLWWLCDWLYWLILIVLINIRDWLL